MNSIRGIPTIYKDVQFRSRLEAKWAAFFDILEWHWEYEPFDLEGWIPDFLLLGKHETLVEVKPIVEFDKAIAYEMQRVAPPKFQLLLLGCTIPPKSLNCHDGWPEVFGWTEEHAYGDDSGYVYPWGDAVLGRWQGQRRPGWCHAEGTFFDRISGQYDGGSWGGGALGRREMELAWKLAGNYVQWRAPA